MVEMQTGLLEEPLSVAARRIALSLLDGTAAAAAALGDRSDPEALHHFRTQVRRLRTVLQLFGEQAFGPVAGKWQRRLARVARATSPARDLQVQLAWARAHRDTRAWQKRLEGRLPAELRRARREASRFFAGRADDLRTFLQRAPHVAEPFGPSWSAAVEQLAEDLSSRLTRVETLEDEALIHQARIRAKRLRHALEPVRGELPETELAIEKVKRLQELLGELRDRQVLVHALEDEGADPLRKAAEKESAALLQTLKRSWLGEELVSLLAVVSAVSARAEAPPQPELTREIERKYLLRALPPAAKKAEADELWQGWIPGKTLQERLRRVKRGEQEQYLRTIKLGRGISRIEVEEEAPKELFEKMWPLTEGKRVWKRRYKVPDGALTWEIDEFLDQRLFLAEVELPSEETPSPIPRWLAPYVMREVTGEDQYVNVNLAR